MTTVSRRGDGDYTSIASAIAAARPGYAVIATETSQHAESLRQLAEADFRGSVLVEKPLFAHSAPAPDYPFASLVVGYNLRFHPVMTAFAERLGGRQAITVSAYVGQDLRDWRPGRDHRTTASATREAGGGVLRDLSHELDYLLWLFGPWQRVAALGGSSGARQVDVDDHLDLLLEMQTVAGGSGPHGLSGSARHPKDPGQSGRGNHRGRYSRRAPHRQWQGP